MPKKAFLYLSILSIVGFILAGILGYIGGSKESPLVTAGQTIAIFAYLLTVFLWYAGLYKTYQRSQQGWIVAILLGTPVASLFYGIYGPEDRPAPQMVPPQWTNQFITAEPALPPYSEDAPLVWLPELTPVSQEEALPLDVPEAADLKDWQEYPRS